jgi:hypothetical protein
MTCLWPLPEGECFPADWDALQPAQQERGRQLASRTIERLTGYQVGTCPVTVRLQPGGRQCCGGFDAVLLHGGSGVVNWGGTWHNCGCGNALTDCEVTLPGPVGRIDEVKVDGVALATSDYHVEDERILVWTGAGDCPFPQGNSADVTVTYVNAYLPEPDGLAAMATLAYEFARACAAKGCRLPANVTNIVRQGISMNVVAGSFPGGKTGIHEVDAYLAQWNPNGLTSPSQVWSLDLPAHRVIGG